MPISSGATGSRRFYLPGAAASSSNRNLRRSSSDQNSINNIRSSQASSNNNNNNNNNDNTSRKSLSQNLNLRDTNNNNDSSRSKPKASRFIQPHSTNPSKPGDSSLEPRRSAQQTGVTTIELKNNRASNGQAKKTMTKSVGQTRQATPTDKMSAPKMSNIGGQMILLGPSSKPGSSSTSALDNMVEPVSMHPNQRPVDVGPHHDIMSCVAPSNKGNNFLHVPNSSNNSHFNRHQFVNTNLASQQKGALNQATGNDSTSSSTARLHSLSNLLGPSAASSQTTPLNIKRNVNLKYIKTLIIVLMAVDLLVTLFVHHFSSQDEITIWFTSHKIRFSLLNLILSSIWFVVLIGAIMFDIYFILVVGCVVDIVSFLLLLIFSILHFSRRIDYNTVNLTSLLLLLFSITVLHVYLIVMATLTVYLAMAVKQRQKSRRRT